MWDTIEPTLSDATDTLTSLGIAFIQAVIVFGIARVVQRFVRDWALRRFDTPYLSERDRTTIGMVTSGIVYVAAMTVLLGLWGVTWSGIIAAISVGTLFILLGVQDVLKSLIGGFFMMFERPYDVGDRIQVRDVTGHVIQIDLRTTIIRSESGHRVVAPNSIVFTDTITNFSLRRHVKSSLVVTGLPSDAAEVKQELSEVLTDLPGVEGEPKVVMRVYRPDLVAAVRRRAGGDVKERRRVARGAEAKVVWFGDGEPQVQETIVARIRERFPNATIRSRAR
jgi:small-conductance mechanosensitive channel